MHSLPARQMRSGMKILCALGEDRRVMNREEENVWSALGADCLCESHEFRPCRSCARS